MSLITLKRISLLLPAIACVLQPLAHAGEGPFFVTYSHQMEEPGNLELATKNIAGKPDGGNRLLGSALESSTA